MSTDVVDCEYCSGKGFNLGYGCPGFRPLKIKCSRCGGTGGLDAVDRKRIEHGKALRDARVADGVSLMERAKELGIKPSELSKIERGGR